MPGRRAVSGEEFVRGARPRAEEAFHSPASARALEWTRPGPTDARAVSAPPPRGENA